MPAHDTIVDRSILPILSARIGERAACDMMQDLSAAAADEEAEVLLRLQTVLGSPSGPVLRDIDRWQSRLHWSAMISPGAHWNGTRLALDQRVPKTVMQGVAGMPLSAVVAHPLLPGDRLITDVKPDGGRTLIHVEADEASAVTLSGRQGLLAERMLHWRSFDRRARHAMHRGIPMDAVLVPILFVTLLAPFILSAANSGAPGGIPAALVVSFGFAALGAGRISLQILGRLMDEGSEIAVLRSYHAVRTITTREEIGQGVDPDPRRHAIL